MVSIVAALNSPGEAAHVNGIQKDGLQKERDVLFGECTVSVPANIALIKYWGKRDLELNLPVNDSVSLTINELFAETTLRILRTGKDRVEINGHVVASGDGTRFHRIFETVRRWERKRKFNGNDSHAVALQFEVISKTNFPVGAGLASSACGFAAIAVAFQRLLALSDAQTSTLARLGSGSAIRSTLGGLVRWKRGVQSGGEDSIAEQLFPANHWPSLHAIILVLDASEKEVGSSKGMQRTVETSRLFASRAETCDARIETIRSAFQVRDFATLGAEIMRDSNSFHALCLDTFPPLMYLSDASRHIIRRVHEFNELSGGVVVAYTFDAGPNACIYLEQETIPKFLEFLCSSLNFNDSALSKVRKITGDVEHSCTSSQFRAVDIIVSGVGGSPIFMEAQN